MYLTDVHKALEISFKANMPLLFWGATGIGKSQVIKEFAIKNGYNFIDLRVGQQEAGDLIGLPRVREVSPGEFRTVWAEPEWWPKDPNSKGILFFDEINRPPDISVIQSLFQIVLAEKELDKNGKAIIEENGVRKKIRKMHTRLLPPGWRLVAAANPDSSEYQVQTLDKAFLARFCQVILQRDTKTSTLWMRDNLHEPEIARFIEGSSKALGKEEKISINTDLNPRAYEMVDDLVKVMDRDKEFNDIGLELISGCIGEEIGIMLFQHLKDNLTRPIPGKDILNTRNFDKLYEEQIKKLIENPNNEKRTELLDVTLEDIVQIGKDKTFTDHQLSNLFRFLAVVPGDLVLSFTKEIIQGESKYEFVKKLRDDDQIKDKDSVLVGLLGSLGIPYDVVVEAEKALKEKIEELEKQELTKQKTK